MIDVLVADDHAIIRDGLRELFADTPDLVMAGEARNAAEVMALVRERSWGILVLDVSMPGKSGLDLVHLIKAERPAMPILVFSMHGDRQYAVRALRAGAAGYLTKESDGEQLIAVIRKLVAGGVYLSPEIADQVARELMPNGNGLPHEQLSDREFEIFLRLAGGDSVSAIAEALSISIKTVSTHKTHIMQKMRLANPAELVRYAIRHRLVQDPEGD